MGKIASLIEDLAGGGEIESSGEFSLDRERAREKMRQFQLADPRRYVLLLAQAAVLKGARELNFVLDADDMVMTFDGEAFSAEDFDQLYTSLFQRHDDRAMLARRELALGLNAAMALNPRWVRVESGSLRLEARADQDDDISEISAPVERTRIHVKDRLRPGRLMQFLAPSGHVPEAELLTHHLAHCPVPVRVNGQQVGQRSWFSRSFVEPIEFKRTGTTILAGYEVDERDHPAHTPAIAFLTHGVWVATHEHRHLPAGVTAVVNTDELRKDVSQADVARNDTYDAIVEHCRELADQVMVAVARRAAELELPPSHPIMKQLRQLLFERMPHEVDTEVVAADPVLDALASVKLWVDIGGQTRSNKELLAHPQGFGYSRATFDGFYPNDEVGLVIHTPTMDMVSQFRGALGRKAKDRSGQLRKAHEREQNRQRWLSQPHPPELPEGVWDSRVTFSQGDVRGEVGLKLHGLLHSEVRVVVEGCLLASWELDDIVPGLLVVLSGPFSPTRSFDRPRRDTSLARAMVLALRAAREAIEQVVDQAAVSEQLASTAMNLAITYLPVATDPDYATRALHALGWKEKTARRQLEGADLKGLAPRLTPGAEEPLSPLARLPLVPTLGSRSISLEELLGLIGALEKVPFVRSDRGPLDIPETVLVLHADRERLLTSLVPGLEAALEDYGSRYAKLRARARFRERPVVPVHPRSVALGFAELVAETTTLDFAFEGSRALQGIAWLNPTGFGPEVICYEVEPGAVPFDEKHPSGRELARLRELELHYDRFNAVVSGPSVEPDDDYDGLIKRSRRRIEMFMGGVELALVIKHVKATGESLGRGPGAGNYLRQRARRLLPDALLAQAWRSLSDTLEPAQAQHHYGCLLAAHARSSRRAEESLEAIGVSAPPTIERLQDAGAKRSHGSRERYYRGLVESLEDLTALSLLESSRGPISVGEVLEAARDSALRYLEPRERVLLTPPPPALVLVLDEYEREWMEELLGPQLEHGREWLEAIAADREMESYPDLDGTNIRGATLVEVDPSRRSGMRGRIGIPDRPPGRERHARVVVGLRGKRIGEFEVPCDFPLVATLDVEEGNGRKVEETVLEPIGRELGRRVGQLLRELADDGDELGLEQRRHASAWFLDYFSRRAAGSQGEPSRMKGKLLRRLAKAEVLPTVDGDWISLVELARGHPQRAEGEVYYSARQRAAGSVRHPVLLVGGYEDVKRLGEVFSRTTSFDEEEQAQARREARLEAAPRLRDREPPEALVRHVLTGRMRGRLWIRPWDVGERPAIELGEQGRQLGVMRLSSPWQVEGGISGHGVEVAEDLSSAALRDKDRKTLDLIAVALYERLASRLRERELDEEQRAQARDLLRPVLLHLHYLDTRRDDLQVEPSEAEARLQRQLHSLPLLRMPDGRHLSLAVALREKPAALVHLELWKPEPPAPDPEPLGDEPEPETRLVPEPEPEPEPPAQVQVRSPRGPSPGELLLEAVRQELAYVRTHDAELLSDAHLSMLTLGSGDGRHPIYAGWTSRNAVCIDVDNEHVRRALEEIEGEGSTLLASFLASSAYSVLNLIHLEITDAHEAVFHALHSRHVLTGLDDADEPRGGTD